MRYYSGNNVNNLKENNMYLNNSKPTAREDQKPTPFETISRKSA